MAAPEQVVRRGRAAPGPQEAEVRLGASLLLVGKLRFSFARNRQHSEFSYDRDFTADSRAFAFAPALPLGLAPYFAAATRATACPVYSRMPHPMPGAGC